MQIFIEKPNKCMDVGTNAQGGIPNFPFSILFSTLFGQSLDPYHTTHL